MQVLHKHSLVLEIRLLSHFNSHSLIYLQKQELFVKIAQLVALPTQLLENAQVDVVTQSLDAQVVPRIQHNHHNHQKKL